MTMKQQAITEDDIHAYVDGQLDDEKTRFIEQAMQTDALLREKIESYQQQNALFHQAYDSVLEEAIPDGIKTTAPQQSKAPLWRNIAASFALLVMGGVIGWSAHSTQVASNAIISTLAQPAAMAHVVYSPEVKHPVEVGADQEKHLVTWLSKRLGNEIEAPALNKLGFNLIGGRLLPSSNGPAAQFMYEDERGERLTLYVRSKLTEEQDTAFRFYEQNGTNTFYWIDGNLGYVLSGAVKREQLLQTANSVYQQLSF